MSMGPWVSYRVGTWLIDECQIAFFMSCPMLRNLDPPILPLFSMSFVLPSTICLVSQIPRIPVLCSPGYQKASRVYIGLSGGCLEGDWRKSGEGVWRMA